MTDLVVTVPKNFEYGGKRGLEAWISEGDAAGDPWTGEEWFYTTWGFKPAISPGERVYVVCNGKLRGYAPLTRLQFHERNRLHQGYVELIREGGAVAVTLDEPVQGFRGWKYRWWDYSQERPFPDWRVP